MRNTRWLSAGICSGLLLAGTASFADGSSPPAAHTPAADAPVDKDFLARALSVNQLEVVLGQMAVERGATPEVKAMGEKMIKKHTELGRQLSDLAQIAPASGPPKLSADQQRTYVRLSSLSGSDFDKSFKATVDAGHVQELAMYREETTRAMDPRLRALAQGRVTALELSMARPSLAVTTTPKRQDW